MIVPLGFGFNPTWLAIILLSLVLGLATQSYINSSFRKWSRVPLNSGMTGAQVAQRVLASNGIPTGDVDISQGPGGTLRVRIQAVGGNLSDNYDPRTKVLNLSQGVYGVSSVAAAGVAAHEAGHAVQDANHYVWGNVRSALVPVANLGSRMSWVMIFAGLLFFAGTSLGYWIVWLGIAFFATAVLFQIVTLPVEFNASSRALAALESTGTLDPTQLAGARQVLTAAALTYVAAALIASLQLLYFVGLGSRRR